MKINKRSLIKILTIIALFFLTQSVNVYAARIANLGMFMSKKEVKPGEEPAIRVTFGQILKKYTMVISYDNKLFKHVSTQNGNVTVGKNTIEIKYDNSKGSQSNKITFKAKEGLTTNNPTQFSIILKDIEDQTGTLKDELSPKVREVTIIPEYKPYQITLDYDGKVKANEVKTMIFNISSELGKAYTNARIEANVKKPNGGEAKLIAISQSGPNNILDNGYGAINGNAIGGSNVSWKIITDGTFTTKGEYTIQINLIDKLAANTVISTESFVINVEDAQIVSLPEKEPNVDVKPQKVPETLPKAGTTIYSRMCIIIGSMMLIIFITKKTNKKEE